MGKNPQTFYEEAQAQKANRGREVSVTAQKRTRVVKKVAGEINKAQKAIEEVGSVRGDADVKILTDAINGFIGAVTPAAGNNSDQQITWANPNNLSDGGNPFVDKGDSAMNELARSIVRIGMINPIEIDEDGVIITGHQRHRASLLGSCVLVPVKVLKGLTPSQRVQRQVAENWTQRKGSAQNVNPMLLVNRMTQNEDGPGG